LLYDARSRSDRRLGSLFISRFAKRAKTSAEDRMPSFFIAAARCLDTEVIEIPSE
jgi:hypothetical protein